LRPKFKEALMANKYMYLYRGSGAPPTSEAEGKAMMAAWMGYFGKLGSALVEGGVPFAPQSKPTATRFSQVATRLRFSNWPRFRGCERGLGAPQDGPSTPPILRSTVICACRSFRRNNKV